MPPVTLSIAAFRCRRAAERTRADARRGDAGHGRAIARRFDAAAADSGRRDARCEDRSAFADRNARADCGRGHARAAEDFADAAAGFTPAPCNAVASSSLNCLRGVSHIGKRAIPACPPSQSPASPNLAASVARCAANAIFRCRVIKRKAFARLRAIGVARHARRAETGVAGRSHRHGARRGGKTERPCAADGRCRSRAHARLTCRSPCAPPRRNCWPCACRTNAPVDRARHQGGA